jgi:hypothetical protein
MHAESQNERKLGYYIGGRDGLQIDARRADPYNECSIWYAYGDGKGVSMSQQEEMAPLSPELMAKERRLSEIIAAMPAVAVAFSGGVDSFFCWRPALPSWAVSAWWR